MLKLTLFTKEIVPVYLTSLGTKVVKARELYKFLQVKEKFADWVKRKIEDHRLIENKDFCCLSEISETQTKSGRKGKSVKSEYIFRLHSGKKIALGTNNERGDQVKDHFIKCEEIASQNIVSIDQYASKSIQKGLVRQVAGTLINNGEVSDLKEHHIKNCEMHFGVRPSLLKTRMLKVGMRCKSFSAREIARRVKPESACSMAYHDDMVSKGHTLEHLEKVRLREKLEPAFKAIMDLGFTPVQMIDKKI
jgi:phage anti-repressor protein